MDLSRYLGLFLSEAREHLDGIERLLADDAGPQRGDGLDALFRHVHSVKGMASTMGYADLAAVAHAVEDALDARRAGSAGHPAEGAAILWEALACMRRIVDAVAAGRDPADGLATSLVRRLRRDDLADPPSPAASDPASAPGAPVPRVAVDLEVDERGAGAAAVHAAIAGIAREGPVERFLPPVACDETAGTRRLRATVRSELDPGEIRDRLAALPGVVGARVAPLPDPPPSLPRAPSRPVAHLRVRADVADELMAAAAELALAHDAVRAALPADADPDLRREVRHCRALARRLLGSISEVRLVPFEDAVPRLVAGAEDGARRLGKRVRVAVDGGDVRIDRSLLEALVDPLMHLARNAIAHGIEDVEERVQSGKPGPGRIRLSIRRERDRVRIEVGDDGRGMDVDALRAAAVRDGAMSADEAARMTDDAALALATRPGLSTAAAPGAVAGRGVGLDVVERAVRDLGGRLHIRSVPGRGTTFRLDLPQSQAIIPALLCRASGGTYAVPVDAVARTVALDPARFVPTVDGPALDERGVAIALRPLADLLGIVEPPALAAARGTALLFRNGTTAAIVEEVLGRREVLVRPLEAPLRSLRGFTGSTVLEDGTIALVLDPAVLS